jgi:uncharacterized protein with GYD domain
MALYLVEHRHTSETCPTRNPEMVRALRRHVAAENAGRMGVKLLADWVDESAHTVVLVVEADSREQAERFAAPFRQVGTVAIKEGQTCEQVAAACLGE